MMQKIYLKSSLFKHTRHIMLLYHIYSQRLTMCNIIFLVIRIGSGSTAARAERGADIGIYKMSFIIRRSFRLIGFGSLPQ